MTDGEAAEFNRRTIEEFRANGGRVGGIFADTPLLLIHHIGVTSGLERVTPLAYSARPDGSIVIVASNGGSPTHPRWYHNLVANSTITVEVDVETFRARVAELTGTARAELWSELVARWPDLAKFAGMVDREIPILVLRRFPGPQSG